MTARSRPRAVATYDAIGAESIDLAVQVALGNGRPNIAFDQLVGVHWAAEAAEKVARQTDCDVDHSFLVRDKK